MDFFNLGEWISKHFKVAVDKCFYDIYFQFESSVPSIIYSFDTYQTWDYFYNKIICNYVIKNHYICNDGIIISLHQLLKENEAWRHLYYVLGKEFYLFLFFECDMYYKWGKDSYILLSSGRGMKTAKSLPYTIDESPSSLYRRGFDKNVYIKIHKILYYTRNRKNNLIIPNRSPNLLKCDILNQHVGPEISKINAFGLTQTKALQKLIATKPTIEDCKLVLDGVVSREENVVAIEKVIIFLKKIIQKFLPYKLVFYRLYLNRFLKNMEQFMKFNLKQKVTLGFVMTGIGENQDPLKRNTIAKVITWIIDKFIINIIRSFFYVSVTDKGHSLVFVKQAYWINFQKKTLSKMIYERRLLKVNFSISHEKLKQITFVPKSNGCDCRPLITNRKLVGPEEDEMKLCNIFLKQLIASKRKNIPSPCSELHSSWLNFTNKRKKDSCYYYVKTDIKDAYGSIIHEKLKHILNKWWNGLEENLNIISFEYKGKWGKYETVQLFSKLPPSTGKKVLIYKPGNEKTVSLESLKSNILSYIDEIFISYSKKHYKLVRGLPQGGKLSAALCEIYYTSFDHDYLCYLYDSNEGDVFVRAVDDYIFISHNEAKIRKFLGMMSAGIPEYGLEIQTDKTITNHTDFIDTWFFHGSKVIFFGYVLDIKNGYIVPNLNYLNGTNIQSTMTFNILDKRILLQKMSSSITLKLHPLLFDHHYQSMRTVLFNIHSASCVMAQKCIATVNFLKMAKVDLEEKYIMFCIEKGIRSIAANAYKKANRNWIDYNVAKKMSFKSFIHILKRKKHYAEIINMLELKASRLKTSSRRVERMINAVGKKLPSNLCGC